MERTGSTISPVTSRVLRRRCDGWSLIEVLFSIAIFSLILVIAFLPFKMTRASMVLGTTRIDKLENVRIEFSRLMRDLRAGRMVTLASPVVLSSGATAYRQVSFTNSSGVVVSYGWNALDTNPTTEWALVRDQKVGGTSQAGFPDTVIAKGVRDFWLQSIPPPGQPLPDGNEATTILGYILVYPDDAARPLPDLARSPLELGSSVTLRN